MPQYFDPRPAVTSRPSAVRLALPDVEADLEADRGVFAAGGVDPGTLELLRAGAPGGPAAGPDPAGALLDLGCGYGPIAAALAIRYPASTVWALDVNERAVALTGANAARLGLANVRAVVAPAVVAPAVVAGPIGEAGPGRASAPRGGGVPPEVRFAQIWSNPPIRIGKEALHALLLDWLPRLAPGGRAWLVVHKHLGSDSLATWLTGQGYTVQRISSKRGYRILRVADGTAPVQ